MTDDTRSRLQKLKDDLLRTAEELRLKASLGTMEARDAWAKLEPKVARFQADAGKLATEVADEFTSSVEKVGHELKAELEKLREKLR